MRIFAKFFKLFFPNKRIHIKGTDTKERRSTQSSVKVLSWNVPTTDTLTQFSHAGAQSTHGEDIRKRSVVFFRHPERDPPFTIGPLLSFPPWKKSHPPWIHLSDTMTKRLLNVPTKEPPPLSLKTSLPGDHLYPSCPLFLTPGGTAASAAPHPRYPPHSLYHNSSITPHPPD